MAPSTLLAPYVGEPDNQQVFERQPSTVRLNCSRILLSRNCTSRVKGFISRRGANDPNGFSGTPLADRPKHYAFGSRPSDIADEYRAVLISCPSRVRNQTILFVSHLQTETGL